MKYKLTQNTKEVKDKTLYQIQALKDFHDVEKGDLGGYIEKELNLSQQGYCWVYDNAMVFGNAQLFDNVMAYNNAMISDNVRITDNVTIFDNVSISGNVLITDNVSLYGDVSIFGDVMISGNTKISGNVSIFGDVSIYDNAKISGNTNISGNANISYNANIKSNNDYCNFDSFGSENRTTTAFKTDNNIFIECGCFEGNINEFIKQVKKTHKGNEYEKQYLAMVELIKLKLG